MNAIISRATWGARYRDGVGNRSLGRLEKYLHHTVTSHLSVNATPTQERAAMRVIERIGQQRFGRGISYTYIIFPSGRIYQGASTHRISYHSGGGRNTRGVGVCLAGNYENNKLATRAFNAIVWLLQEGVRRGWWGDPALTSYHRQFRSTACPGRYAINRFSALNTAGRGGNVTVKVASPPKGSTNAPAQGWRVKKTNRDNVPVYANRGADKRQVGTASNKGYGVNVVKTEGSWTQVRWKYDGKYRNAWVATAHLEDKFEDEQGADPQVKPASSGSSDRGYPYETLPLTNSHTTASHNAWVYLMRHAVNRTDRNLTINMQRWLRDLGYYKRNVDGDFGAYTVEALQLFLRDKGLYTGVIDAHTAPYHVARGPRMIRAEIQYLNDQAKYLV